MLQPKCRVCQDVYSFALFVKCNMDKFTKTLDEYRSDLVNYLLTRNNELFQEIT